MYYPSGQKRKRSYSDDDDGVEDPGVSLDPRHYRPPHMRTTAGPPRPPPPSQRRLALANSDSDGYDRRQSDDDDEDLQERGPQESTDESDDEQWKLKMKVSMQHCQSDLIDSIETCAIFMVRICQCIRFKKD